MKRTPKDYASVEDFIAAALAAGVDVHKYADPIEDEATYCPEWEDGNIIMVADEDPSLLWFDAPE